jgi:hypothetical protein
MYFTRNPDNLIQVDIIPPDLVSSLETLLSDGKKADQRINSRRIFLLTRQPWGRWTRTIFLFFPCSAPRQ